MQSPDPPKEEIYKRGPKLTYCHDCDGVKYRNLKTSKATSYSPFNET